MVINEQGEKKMSLSISSEMKEPGVYFLHLAGSLDTNTFMSLEKRAEEILAMTPRAIVLDMKELDYISSMGVRAVLKTRKAMQEIGGKLALVNVQPGVKKVFEIINALPSQRIFSNIQELDNYLDQMQKNVR
jgi:anti-anti-sigma factor